MKFKVVNIFHALVLLFIFSFSMLVAWKVFSFLVKVVVKEIR